MQSLKIITSQNIEIEYEVAGVGYRLLAAIIDLSVMIGYLILLAFGSDFIDFESLISVLVLPIMGYSLLQELFLGGQTIGKRLCHIKVVRTDGSQPSLGDYLIRWLFRIPDVWLLSGALAIVMISYTKKGQRLGDLAAGTTLIRLKSKESLGQTILVEFDQSYQPQFPQAARLSDREANLVREVLLAAENDPDLAEQLCEKIISRFQIETNLHPRVFLSTFLADFNFYTGKSN